MKTWTSIAMGHSSELLIILNSVMVTKQATTGTLCLFI